jgi:LCP family protein required for cell wall assembly
MVDAPDPERGKYKRYRSTPRFRARTGADPAEGLAELRALRTGQGDAQGDGSGSGQDGAPRRSRSLWRRGARLVLVALAAWIGVSVLVFIVSSLTATGVPSAAVAALDSGGTPPFSATTILVLGLDGRPPGLKEPGAAQDSESGGPVRSDSMMLIRTGGGHTSRMSIPRDTLVNLPGYGLQKINAAYFYGGAAFSIREVESFLGIKINHVLVVNFTNFEALVNAMGGVNWTGGCVDSQIDGGAALGGWTLDLRPGTHHLDGLQALLLSQTRDNLCNPAWTDLTRELNQQTLLANMKSQIFSPVGFIHLPWIAWYAPQTLETDMNAAELAAVASSMTLFGSGKTQILLPTGSEDVPGVGDSLTITDAAKQADVARFLAG